MARTAESARGVPRDTVEDFISASHEVLVTH
jgi:hypothetical protein